VGLKQFFSRADWYFYSVLCRRNGTGPHLVVGAVWIVSKIDIHEEVVAMQLFRFWPPWIGFSDSASTKAGNTHFHSDRLLVELPVLHEI
jgi:hypothetical protein